MLKGVPAKIFVRGILAEADRGSSHACLSRMDAVYSRGGHVCGHGRCDIDRALALHAARCGNASINTSTMDVLISFRAKQQCIKQ